MKLPYVKPSVEQLLPTIEPRKQPVFRFNIAINAKYRKRVTLPNIEFLQRCSSVKLPE